PPIVRTIATKGAGVGELADAFDEHRRHLRETGRWDAVVRRQAEAELQEALLLPLEGALSAGPVAEERARLIDAGGRRDIPAFEAADRLLRRIGVDGCPLTSRRRRPAPAGDGELEVVDGPMEGGPLADLPEAPEIYAPEYDPAEIYEIAQKLMSKM